MLNNREPIPDTATFKENVLSEEEVREKHVKVFLDMIILVMLNDMATYGYKIISVIHKEFGVLLSPASLYPRLHLLENNKLIESNFDGGKTEYCMTPKGKETLERKIATYNLYNQIMRNFIKTCAKIPQCELSSQKSPPPINKKMLLIVILGVHCPSITQSTNYIKALTTRNL